MYGVFQQPREETSRQLKFQGGSTMRWSVLLSILAALILAVPLSSARAAFTALGDVLPADPSSWTSSTIGYIGQTSAGTLTVADGSILASGDAYLGFYSGANGLVTISGPARPGPTSAASTSAAMAAERSPSPMAATLVASMAASAATPARWESRPWTGQARCGPASAARVGDYGGGTLSVSNGGAIFSSGGIIGSSPDSTVEPGGWRRLDVDHRLRRLCRLLGQRNALDHQWRQRQQ